jgi:hypothetical protein
VKTALLHGVPICDDAFHHTLVENHDPLGAEPGSVFLQQRPDGPRSAGQAHGGQAWLLVRPSMIQAEFIRWESTPDGRPIFDLVGQGRSSIPINMASLTRR